MKPEDMKVRKEQAYQPGLTVDREACISCSLCARTAPEYFEMRDKKARAIQSEIADPEKVRQAAEACPVKAIHYIPESED